MRRFAEIAWQAETGGFAIDAALDERRAFIRRTYSTLLIELCGVAALASLFVRTGIYQSVGPVGGIIGLIAIFFVLPRMLAERASPGQQKIGALLCITFYGFIMAPLAIWVPVAILWKSTIVTGCVFGGLTAYAFTTKKDFSFLGGMLHAGLWMAIGIGIVSLLFGGFGGTMQLVYSGAIILLFAGFVLYDTSKIIHHYRVNQHIAAGTMLMIDVVVLFYHITMLFMASQSD